MSNHYSLQKSAAPWLFLSVGVLIIDQICKALANHFLIFGKPFEILPIFNLTLTYNRGVAFGLLNIPSLWPGPLFTIIATIAITLLTLWLWQLAQTAYMKVIGISLIIGGAAGNLADRLFRDHVVDFFDMHWKHWHYPVFNTADIAICVGVILLIIALWRSKEL